MSLLQSLGGALTALAVLLAAIWAARRKGASEAAKTFNDQARKDDEKRADDLRRRVDAAKLRPDDKSGHYRD